MVAARKDYSQGGWATLLVQHAYYSLTADAASDHDNLNAKILARVCLSPVCAALKFHDWTYKPPASGMDSGLTVDPPCPAVVSWGKTNPGKSGVKLTVDKLLKVITSPCSRHGHEGPLLIG